jgi:superkiller protein 3
VAWLRLGEAYSKAGRHVAAIKALKKAQELQPGNWLCDYSLGEVQRQLGQFSEAIESFQAILEIQPTELGALQALSQTYLDMGLFDSSQNFVARAEESYAHCIHYALSAIAEHTGFRGMAWKNIGDGLFHLSCLSSFNDLDNVNSIFGQVHALLTSPHGERIGQLAPQFSYPSRPDASSNPIAALELAILAYDHRISLGFTEVSVSASAWYDLGTSIHAWANRTKAADETISQKAISYVKRALQEDPGNDNYWNTYGNLHFTSNPKLAQHAYIRAAEIDNKV